MSRFSILVVVLLLLSVVSLVASRLDLPPDKITEAIEKRQKLVNSKNNKKINNDKVPPSSSATTTTAGPTSTTTKSPKTSKLSNKQQQQPQQQQQPEEGRPKSTVDTSKSEVKLQPKQPKQHQKEDVVAQKKKDTKKNPSIENNKKNNNKNKEASITADGGSQSGSDKSSNSNNSNGGSSSSSSSSGLVEADEYDCYDLDGNAVGDEECCCDCSEDLDIHHSSTSSSETDFSSNASPRTSSSSHSDSKARSSSAKPSKHSQSTKIANHAKAASTASASASASAGGSSAGSRTRTKPMPTTATAAGIATATDDEVNRNSNHRKYNNKDTDYQSNNSNDVSDNNKVGIMFVWQDLSFLKSKSTATSSTSTRVRNKANQKVNPPIIGAGNEFLAAVTSIRNANKSIPIFLISDISTEILESQLDPFIRSNVKLVYADLLSASGLRDVVSNHTSGNSNGRSRSSNSSSSAIGSAASVGHMLKAAALSLGWDNDWGLPDRVLALDVDVLVGNTNSKINLISLFEAIEHYDIAGVFEGFDSPPGGNGWGLGTSVLTVRRSSQQLMQMWLDEYVTGSDVYLNYEAGHQQALMNVIEANNRYRAYPLPATFNFHRASVLPYAANSKSHDKSSISHPVILHSHVYRDTRLKVSDNLEVSRLTSMIMTQERLTEMQDAATLVSGSYFDTDNSTPEQLCKLTV